MSQYQGTENCQFAGFFTFSSGTATRRSRNRFPTRRGGFCLPGTGGAITGATDAVPVPSMGTATEVGPLTSSPPGRGQSSGGALWTPAYTPGDGHASWVSSNNPVLHLYISCYVTVNKQCCRTSCCACFHSGDPDKVVHFVLYIVLLYTPTSAAISASRSLFRLRQ